MLIEKRSPVIALMVHREVLVAATGSATSALPLAMPPGGRNTFILGDSMSITRPCATAESAEEHTIADSARIFNNRLIMVLIYEEWLYVMRYFIRKYKHKFVKIL